jgi:hypothetical protein
MKKSLLIIATLFLVQLVHAQNQLAKPQPNHGNQWNHAHQPTYNNSNSYNGCYASNTVACCSPNYGHHSNIHHGIHNGNHYGNRFMSNQELNAVMRAIQNESFSSDKLAIARQAVMFQNVKANQVVEMGSLFSFESDRLEFAKMAYKNTIDKQNYYLVNSIFHFSSSKRELNNFIYR